LQPGGHLFGFPQHPQDVPARQPPEVLVAPAPARELGEEPRVPGDVLEPLGPAVVAVVVASEPDGLDARDLADVVDVIRHVRDRHPHLRQPVLDLLAQRLALLRVLEQLRALLVFLEERDAGLRQLG
jgi:hypothetical protein